MRLACNQRMQPTHATTQRLTWFVTSSVVGLYVVIPWEPIEKTLLYLRTHRRKKKNHMSIFFSSQQTYCTYILSHTHTHGKSPNQDTSLPIKSTCSHILSLVRTNSHTQTHTQTLKDWPTYNIISLASALSTQTLDNDKWGGVGTLVPEGDTITSNSDTSDTERGEREGGREGREEEREREDERRER